MAEEAGEGGELCEELIIDLLLEIQLGTYEIEVGHPVDGEGAVGCADDGRRVLCDLLLVILIVDLSDERLEDVLEGDDAGGAAILVDDDEHV